MSNSVESRYVVVANDQNNYRAIVAHSGKNGGENNYTYKTQNGAIRRLDEKQSEDSNLKMYVVEVKVDLAVEGEEDAAERAVRAAKRWF